MAHRSRQRVDRDAVVARNGAVAATRRAQAEAGLACLQEGGSAVDAAVAVGFMAAVMEPMETCLGGAGFLLVWDPASGKPWCYEFPPRAPRAALPDMYEIVSGDARRNTLTVFAVRDDANAVGYRAAALPGLVAGLVAAHQRFGRLPLSRVVEPAIAVAQEGFPADYYYCWIAAAYLPTLLPFPKAASTFLDAGRVPAADPPLRVRQPALADTLRQIARDGGESFYRGDIAASMIADIQAGGGIMSREDLASYQVDVTEGRRIRYRDVDVIAPTAPGGHWTEQQILNILAAGDLRAAGHNSTEALHTLIEASRMAFADRYYHLGDPDFEPVPVDGLLSAAYGAELARRIEPGAARAETPGQDEPWSHYAFRPTNDPWPFDPAGPAAPKTFAELAPAGAPGSGTTHFCAVDADRMLVSCTHTAAQAFGAKFVTEAGVHFNAGMNWFTAAPGAANSIAGWKRPVVNMGPVLTVRDGKPHMALGAPGGRRIIGSVVQVLSNVVDHGMSMQEACTAARTDSSSRTTLVDDRIAEETVAALEQMGHRIELVSEEGNATGYEFAHPTSILVGDDGNVHCGVDPFRKMEAVGYFSDADAPVPIADRVRPVPSDAPLPDSYLAFDGRPFRLRMGLKPLDDDTWIELDDRFDTEMALKDQLHWDHHDDVVVALPGSEDACAEVLDELVGWLRARYPGRLAARREALERAAARPGAASRRAHPIETAGLLVQEDLCVLVPDGQGGLPLVAGSVSFPSRWRLRDKVGLPMAAVHGPVAQYATQLANPVDAGLARLTPGRGVWRVNWNLFDDPSLFQLGGHGRPEVNEAITPDNAGDTMWLRVERQTFRRFAVHQSVLFTIRTLQRPLATVAARADLAARLAAALRGMPPETAAYKSVNVWRKAVLAYLDARC